MNVLNILHLPWLAGTEYSYFSMCNILKEFSNVYCLVPKNAKITPLLVSKQLRIFENNKLYKNPRIFDFILKYQIRYLVRKYKIDIIIANSGRITKISKQAANNLCPVISMNHGTNPKKTALADYAFVLNRTTLKKVTDHGMNLNNIFLIPNHLNLQNNMLLKENHHPPVIGFLGRLAKEKGVEYFIEALNVLNKEKIAFRAIIAGDGILRKTVESLIQEYKLDDKIKIIGWISDKDNFFSQIDIFCLSSIDEAFGIVLLEAMKYKVPIVSTDCEGPIDILNDNYDALICKKKDSRDMANKIALLLENNDLREFLANNAYKTLVSNYSSDIVSKKIKDALDKISNDFKIKSHENS